MMAKKTIKAKLLDLRNRKEELLRGEYDNWQRFLRGDSTASLYSATRQQAERFLRRIKKQNGSGINPKEYPMILRRDVYHANTKMTPYWLKIPVYGVRGGINVPIKTHMVLTEKMVFREAKLIRRDDEWFVFLTVEEDIPTNVTEHALAVDVGIHNMAVTVNSSQGQPKFYGSTLRQIRGHYFHLRRKLGQKKAYKTIKKVGRHERLRVNHELHKISKAIVQEAKTTNASIILGNLKHIRRKNSRGRSFNRRLHSMPFQKLASYIEYKAAWEGIPIIKVSEAYTSQTCSRCGERGRRVAGLFKCNNCGLDLNSDWNGARNILQRGIGELERQSILGAQLTAPANLVEGRGRTPDEPRIPCL